MSARLRRAVTPVLVVVSFILMFAGIGTAMMTQPIAAYVFKDVPNMALGPAIALLGYIILFAIMLREGRHAD